MQIHGVDGHLGDGRRRRLLHQRVDSRPHERLPRGQHRPQGRFHRRLALLRRQVQDAKILLVRCGRVL
jgi:hypothetical protein